MGSVIPSPARATRPSPKIASRELDLAALRRDFPILARQVNGRPLVYLDNAASSQKPTVVIEAVAHYYRHYHANVHRGVHTLSQEATAAYEAARETVRRFLGARSAAEIVFVRGTTEAINLVAQAYGRQHVGRGDEVLLSTLEHHSNIVPWQLLCGEVGATVRVVPIDNRGDLILEEYERLLTDRTRIVALSHVSNGIGTINPVKRLVELAHRRGVPVLLDGAQAAPHLRIDVAELDCDFYAFSGHKVFGPTGIGALYGKQEQLAAMPPWQGGGEMIRSVSFFSGTTFAEPPYRFEAGTPDISGAIGLGAALEYLESLDQPALEDHEARLLRRATEGLLAVPGVRIIGEARHKASVVSFVLEGVHAHDLGTVLDREGVAVRAGHHCAQPLLERFGVPATARASFAFYNTEEEVERLLEGVGHAREIFR